MLTESDPLDAAVGDGSSRLVTEREMSQIVSEVGARLEVGVWLGIREGCDDTDGMELGKEDGGIVGPSLGIMLLVGEVEGRADGATLGR